MKWLILFTGCLMMGQLDAQQPKIKIVISGIPSSIRGLSVVDDHVAWISGSKGYVGRSLDGGKSWKVNQIKSFEKLDFRSLYAFDSLTALIANAGSPASILKTNDGGKSYHEVYHNNHLEIFLDGMDFWDAENGMVYGDPIEGRMMLLKTLDGGETWNEMAHDQRPSLEKGEASFAASGTGIRCYEKNKIVVATGGMVSRLWISPDRGGHWSPRLVPVVQGKNSTGIFSVGMKQRRWIVVGGDFVEDSASIQNNLYSLDDGKNWITPRNSTRGFRSCVEFISGKEWIALGQGGIDLSHDNGINWLPLSDEKGLHVVRKARKGQLVLAAGNGKICLIDWRAK